MSATFPRTLSVPRRRIAWPPLIALGFLLLIGLVAVLPARRESPVRVLATRALRVEASGDGAVVLRDADTGAVAGTVAAGGESFVRGVLYSTAVTRRLHGVDPLLPYRLTALSNGRLTLADAATHATIDLMSFGATNARAFAVMLDAPVQEAR